MKQPRVIGESSISRRRCAFDAPSARQLLRNEIRTRAIAATWQGDPLRPRWTNGAAPLAVGLPPALSQDAVEHLRRQLPGKRVLLADVVRADEADLIRQLPRRAMAEI